MTEDDSRQKMLEGEALQRMYRAKPFRGKAHRGRVAMLAATLACWALLGYALTRVVA
jgi:hypothetical protein